MGKTAYPEFATTWGRRLSVIIVYVLGFSGKEYVEDPTRILTRFVSCPLTGTPHRLNRYGSYRRYLIVLGVLVTTCIYRKACRECKVTFSLLPGCALAYHHHLVDVIAARIWAAIQGTSCRNRDFLVANASDVPNPEPGISWSDLLDSVQTWPCYQLLARWSRTFGAMASRRLYLLTSACIVLKVDLQRLAHRVADIPGKVPDRLLGLAHSLGLRHAARRQRGVEASAELEDCLPDLLRFLNGRLLPEKHKVLQASAGRLRYDYLVT